MRFLQVMASAFLVTLGSTASAQEFAGSLSGIVTIEDGAVVPGAIVTVKSLAFGLTKRFSTSQDGTYLAPRLPPGAYELTFAFAGFEACTVKEVRLHVGDRVRVDAVLFNGLREIATSCAFPWAPSAPTIESYMSSTQINELPFNNRNFVQMAALVPGVSSDLEDEVGTPAQGGGLTPRASLSMNGTRRSAVNWLVDGAQDVDVGSNVRLLVTPTLDSIEEIKIITSSNGPEWARSGGGIVNVTTKAGTNDVRFSAYEYMRNDALNANSFVRKLSGDPSLRDHPPHLRYNNFGFSVGAPLRKDKMFLFFSEDWRLVRGEPTGVVASVPDPQWLLDPASPNFVPVAQRDPNAVKLLAAWPSPNIPDTHQFVDSQPSTKNTRQEVARLDYVFGPRWHLTARYTHEKDETDVPNTLNSPSATPIRTEVPGQVLVLRANSTLTPSVANALFYQLSTNRITDSFVDTQRIARSDFGITTPTVFAGHTADKIPVVSVSGLSTIGASQLRNVRYLNHSVGDSLTLQHGDHTLNVGTLVSLERKDESSPGTTQGTYTFVSGGGLTSFQNFIRGNDAGRCGPGCTYRESQMDVVSHLRFSRFELYAQDTVKLGSSLTLDVGARYYLFPPVVDANNLLVNFSPQAYDRSRAPTFSSTGASLLAGTGDALNGLLVAGGNEPHGRALYAMETGNIGPRLGVSWSPYKHGQTLLRGAYGMYYDQALVGIFEQNAFTDPPFTDAAILLNPALSNPTTGQAPLTLAPRDLVGTSDPFRAPRTQRWSVGVVHRPYDRGLAEISYVGSRGDRLIRPVDINQPQPQDVNALFLVSPKLSQNLVRPYPGYRSIVVRETTGTSRYQGLLVSFRHDGGRAGFFQVSYTLSRAETDASSDRDTVDLPQNPLDKAAEFGLAGTDRTHVFTANYVVELPFFKDTHGWLGAFLRGWQLAGITTFQSGPPADPVAVSTDNGRRGGRANVVKPIGPPPSPGPGGLPYWFDPSAFAPPTFGTYGNSGRAPLRLPGRNQWDLSFSKNFYPARRARLQLRADLINAFNHTQFNAVDTSCLAVLTTCVVPGGSFGRVTSTRQPREIELGLRVSWN